MDDEIPLRTLRGGANGDIEDQNIVKEPEDNVDKQPIPSPASPPTAHDLNWPSSPENPFNWPLWKRIYVSSVPALGGFAVTIGSSIYAPAVSDIVTEFKVSITVALLPLSAWVLGLAFGPVLGAPISESYGRKYVYLISMFLCAVITVGAGFSNNIVSLIICRFFGGFFGSPALALGAGTNADTWQLNDRAVSYTVFIFSPFAGTAVGPVIGGYASQAKGWRWTEWPIVFFAVVVWLMALAAPETYKKIILQRRTKRLNTGPTQSSGPGGVAALKMVLTVTLIRPLKMLFMEPIVGFLSVYIAFNFSVLFGFFGAFPLVFQDVYGFDRGSAGLPWLAVLGGCLLSCVTTIGIDKTIYRKHYLRSLADGRNGAVAPEHRLYAAMLGSLGLPIGLFWFAWTAKKGVHWISPVLAIVPFAWGNLTLFTSAALYLLDTYGAMMGASAMAANGLLRYICGAVFPLFTTQMYQALTTPWATTLYAFIACALLPIPWVLFRFGRVIRSRSRFDALKD